MIPVAIKKQTKAERRKELYKMYVELTQRVKEGFKDCTEEELVSVIQASMKLMTPPEGVEEVTLTVESLKQTALLAAQATARQLYERQKK
jgi:hypothetical protein